MPSGDSKWPSLTPKIDVLCHWLTLGDSGSWTHSTCLSFSSWKGHWWHSAFSQDSRCSLVTSDFPRMKSACAGNVQRTTAAFHHQVLPPPLHISEKRELKDRTKWNILPLTQLQSNLQVQTLQSLKGIMLLARVSLVMPLLVTHRDIVLQLLYLGKVSQKLLSANSETGWTSTISTAGWEGKNLLSKSVLGHTALPHGRTWNTQYNNTRTCPLHFPSSCAPPFSLPFSSPADMNLSCF